MNRTARLFSLSSTKELALCALIATWLLACDSATPPSSESGSAASSAKESKEAAMCQRSTSIAVCGKACDVEPVGGPSCQKAYELSAKSLRARQKLFRRRIGKNRPSTVELEHFQKQLTPMVQPLLHYAKRACSNKQPTLCFGAAQLLGSLLATLVPDPAASAKAPRQRSKPQLLRPPKTWLKARDELMLRSCDAKHQPACLASARYWLGRDNTKAEQLLARGGSDAVAGRWLQRSKRAASRCQLGQATGCIEEAAIVFAADRARFPVTLGTTYKKLLLGPPISEALFAKVVKLRGLGMLPAVGSPTAKGWASEDQRPDLKDSSPALAPTTPTLVFESLRTSGTKVEDAMKKRIDARKERFRHCIAASSNAAKAPPPPQAAATKPAAASKASSTTLRLGFWIDGNGSPFNLSPQQRRDPFFRCIFASIADKRLSSRGPASVVLTLKKAPL